MTSVLSDELLESLIAAGQADVVVGLPTANNAATIAPVARAVVEAFSGPLVRQRTVLLSPDGGSSDGTPELVRRAGAAEGDLIVTGYSLRTIHRISAPYHGLPGRAGALQIVFTAAELLRARAVVVLDPTATSLTAGDVAHFAAAVLDGGADYVKPVVPRRPADGPLVTQLVRPLLRAAYGARLREPIDTQLAASGRFVQSAVAAHLAAEGVDDAGLDVFLSAHAMGTRQHLLQVSTASHGEPSRTRRPSTREVFHQVVRALFSALARDQAAWSSVRGSEEVPVRGEPILPAGEAPSFTTAAYVSALRDAVDALAPIHARVLGEALHEELRRAASAASPGLDDDLWARLVYGFLLAGARGVLSTDELAGALEPVYLGRVATVGPELARLGAADGEARLEAIATTFERHKPGAIELGKETTEP